jgi:hypothetical protein
MKCKSIALLCSMCHLLLALAVPGAWGEDLIVEHNPASGNFATIQAAIDEAKVRLNANSAASLVIKVRADDTPYNGSFTPISKVNIQGESETARTFISGGGTLVTMSGVSNVTIKNLTFQTATTGISISNCSGITIANNIFRVTGGTAVQVQGNTAGLTTIVNNTFYQNSTAISTTTSNILITNNIFSTNSTAISAPGVTLTLNEVSYNDFHLPNTVLGTDLNSLPNISAPNPDPLFVDPSLSDFHLLPNSPAHSYILSPGGTLTNAGNPGFENVINPGSFDMGAYGGPNSDKVPKKVTGLAFAPAATGSVGLTWGLNRSYQVSGYNVYFGPSTGFIGTVGTLSSPIFVAQGTNSTTLDNLPTTAVTPAAPVLTGALRSNQALALTWTVSDNNATRFVVFYAPAPAAVDLTATSVTVPGGGSARSFLLPGLQNGVTYNVAIQAVNDNQFFFTVTAVNNHPGAASPGLNNESSFADVLSRSNGDPLPSPLSNSLSGTPEAIAPFPNLKGEGCFIATAAYGFYSAPQVQVLRDFRDRFLLTNAPGRAFVAWYYRYGPIGAHFINTHPWLKLPVRVALFPLLVAALVLTCSASAEKLAIAVLASLLLAALVHRKLPSLRGALLKKLLLALFICSLPGLAQGAEMRPDRPHWSLELKGGAFFPGLSGWSKFYGSSYQGEYGGALAYKVLRQLEVGLEGSYLQASGTGQFPSDQTLAGKVTIERVPLDVFVLGRAVFDEGQWLVPYAGGGYTRLFYREEVKGQGTTQGSVNGFHVRGGVQLLLDGMEPNAARSLYLDYGIHHTYFFLEGKYLRALADTVQGDSVNLGGTSALAGFLLEF